MSLITINLIIDFFHMRQLEALKDQNFLWNGEKLKWYKVSVNYYQYMTHLVILAHNVQSL